MLFCSVSQENNRDNNDYMTSFTSFVKIDDSN